VEANIGSPEPATRHQAIVTVKDRAVTRLAVLKVAAEFAASRSELRSGEVLKIPASWASVRRRPCRGRRR
jgi:hypothetical protein